MREQYIPKRLLEKIGTMDEQCVLRYWDPISYDSKNFNLKEVFEQMCSGAKLNILHEVFNRLLSEEEQSMFLADLLERYNND